MRFAYSPALLALTLALPAAAQNYDLKADWSDTQNPNGPWSFRQGTALLPAINWFQQTFCSNNGGWSGPTGGWALTQDGTGRIPLFIKSRGNETPTVCGGTFERDWQTGDVIMHSYDPSSGGGNGGEGSVVWTSPFDGLITITGNIWHTRNIGRSNDWFVRHEYFNNNPASVIAQGTVASGGTDSRANPRTFTSGAAVPSDLVNRFVAKGDQIRLLVQRTSGSVGDFAGINMSISTCVGITQQPPDIQRVCPGTPVSTISTSAIASSGTLTYKWFKGGVPITDAPPRITGSDTPTLTIRNATWPDDNGLYTCRITGGCQVRSTTNSSFVVNRPCNIADITSIGGPSAGNCGDGQLSADDVVAFLDAFFNQRPAADIVGLGGALGADGRWTADDIISFLAAFFNGCAI
jgi:hypothetical protein